MELVWIPRHFTGISQPEYTPHCNDVALVGRWFTDGLCTGGGWIHGGKERCEQIQGSKASQVSCSAQAACRALGG
jgi:hypothetical protein